MVKRIVVMVALAAALAGLGAVAPASAEVARKDPPPTCVYVPGSYVQMNDSFHCQVPPPGLQFTVYPSDVGICFFAAGLQDAAHPYPNGWGNAISSMKNITQWRLETFDAQSCGGAVLFAMAPYTMRATLVTAANNKVSAFRWVTP